MSMRFGVRATTTGTEVESKDKVKEGNEFAEEMEQDEEIGYNDIDNEMIMAQIQGHDHLFNKEDKSMIYKEIVFFFKPAMNS